MTDYTNVRIGTRNISRVQRNYLARALASSHPPSIARQLLYVINDDDILSGQEQLSPRWADFYKQSRNEFDPDLLSELDTLFENKFLAGTDPRSLSIRFYSAQAHPSLNHQRYPRSPTCYQL